MLASVWSFFGLAEEPNPPPPVTVTGVRIPADGTPAHLLSLTTISDTKATDSFLFHVPDLRRYWNSGEAWEYRDLLRLDLHQHFIPSYHRQQNLDVQRLLLTLPVRPTRQQLLHFRQRHRLPQQYHAIQQQHSSCTGAYYVFHSFAVDYLPKNLFVPAWISDIGDRDYRQYCGDVFIVKMARHERGEYGWAAYEDMVPQFLDLLVEGLHDD